MVATLVWWLLEVRDTSVQALRLQNRKLGGETDSYLRLV